MVQPCADLEPGEFAAIAQRLRRRAQRDEGIDRAVVADRGLRRDVHMRDQLAVRADHDMGADDAVGTDRGALADHGAVLNPRGGIDHAHRMVRCPPVRLLADVFDFPVVSAAYRRCPVTYGYAVLRDFGGVGRGPARTSDALRLPRRMRRGRLVHREVARGINRSASRRHRPRRPSRRSPWRRRETTTWSCAGRSSACDIRWCRRASPVCETCTCRW